jgi:hypothetical protein
LNEVKLIKGLSKTQMWSVRKIEKKLDLNRSAISRAIKLAEGLTKYPELKKCRNKNQAIRLLKESESQMIAVRSVPEKEIEIQKYLYKNWEKTTFAAKWELIRKGTQANGNYVATNCGIIDLLAKDKKGKGWLVVELKRDQGSDDTVGQLLRYMGWVKENLSEEKDIVHGLIIASSSDDHLRLALSCVENTSYKVFRRRGNDWEFISETEANVVDYFLSLSPEERKRQINEIRSKA